LQKDDSAVAGTVYTAKGYDFIYGSRYPAPVCLVSIHK